MHTVGRQLALSCSDTEGYVTVGTINIYGLPSKIVEMIFDCGATVVITILTCEAQMGLGEIDRYRTRSK